MSREEAKTSHTQRQPQWEEGKFAAQPSRPGIPTNNKPSIKPKLHTKGNTFRGANGGTAENTLEKS
jgi:hypothetical protein